MKLFRALSVLLVCLIVLAPLARAETELEAKISAKNAELKALQEEIAKYQAQLDQIGTEKKNLEGQVQTLDISRKKIATDIAVTQNRIATANLELQELSGHISDASHKIEVSRDAIGKSLALLGRIDATPLVEHFLVGADLARAWVDADQLHTVQSALGDEVHALDAARTALEQSREDTAEKQRQLQSYTKQLSGQKVVLDQTRQMASSLLTQTKNKESTYQQTLAEKKAQAAQLESEIRDYENKLQYTYDPSLIPSPGAGVIKFPFESAYMTNCAKRQSVFGNLYCITQYFGNTPFAKSGAYNGAGHNGIDFGAPTGTKIVSVLSGTVVATGDTDTVPGCYSFGKWVLIKHGNGLSSLYAHLSYSAVQSGQAVDAGDFVGLSGATGYATGPHLHFGLYASDAVQIVRLGSIKSVTNCAAASVPVAPTAAYLNPINYF